MIGFNYYAVSERYNKIGEAMGIDLDKMTAEEKRKAILDEIARLKTSVGIVKTLGERGVRKSDIPELSKKAMEDPCMVTNPRQPDQRDIEVVYEEAL